MILPDRTYAAFLLAEQLKAYRNLNSIVLAIPTGGVPVGYHIAKLLRLPLGIILCKKIGHPANLEYAIGSISPDNVYDGDLSSRLCSFVAGGEQADLNGKKIIIVDDGITTGMTLSTCINYVKMKDPAQVIIAVPVASSQAAALLTPLVDDFHSLISSRNFQSVAQFYKHFPEVTEGEVRRFLSKAQLNSGIIASKSAGRDLVERR